MKKVLILALLVIIAKHSFCQKNKDSSGKYLDTFFVFVENGKNVITWISKTEKNVSWYLLERSTDGKEYTSAILYDSGSLNKKAYQFKDSGKPENIRSYRILILDSKSNILDVQYFYIKQTEKEVPPIERYTINPLQNKGFSISSVRCSS